MRSGHPQQGVPSVATQQLRLQPLLVELAAARARAAGGAGGARAAAADGVFPKIKAHPTDLGGATQEHIPCSNSKASSSKAMQASSQAPQGRAAALPQGITIM